LFCVSYFSPDSKVKVLCRNKTGVDLPGDTNAVILTFAPAIQQGARPSLRCLEVVAGSKFPKHGFLQGFRPDKMLASGGPLDAAANPARELRQQARGRLSRAGAAERVQQVGVTADLHWGQQADAPQQRAARLFIKSETEAQG
jgi:hypothetical protein